MNKEILFYNYKNKFDLAKNENIAKKLFQKQLDDTMCEQNIAYVISQKELLTLLQDKATRILVTADLDMIKERFAQRMNRGLPVPAAAMLERKQ